MSTRLLPSTSRVRTLLALTLAASVALVTGTGLSAGDADAAVKHTIDGHTILVKAYSANVRPVAPMGSPVLNRAGLMKMDVRAAIEGIKSGEVVKATLEVGYIVGNTAKIGDIDVALTTPDLAINGGVNSKLGLSATIGVDGKVGGEGNQSGGGGSAEVAPHAEIGPSAEIGGELGFTSNIIPAQKFSFKVSPGSEETVKVASIDLTKPHAEVYVEGVRISVGGALGPVGAQSYARLTVTTETGSYVLYTYSKRTEL